MNRIQVYSSDHCPWCIRAKALLRASGLDFEEIDLSSDPARVLEMIERSGRRTVPQMFVNGESIGGFEELSRLNPAELPGSP